MESKEKSLKELQLERLKEQYEGETKVEEIRRVVIKTGKETFSDTILNNQTRTTNHTSSYYC